MDEYTESTQTLTFEQSLQLRTFTDSMKQASPKQVFDMLMFVYTEMMKQKNSYNTLLKKAWGIE